MGFGVKKPLDVCKRETDRGSNSSGFSDNARAVL